MLHFLCIFMYLMTIHVVRINSNYNNVLFNILSNNKRLFKDMSKSFYYMIIYLDLPRKYLLSFRIICYTAKRISVAGIPYATTI